MARWFKLSLKILSIIIGLIILLSLGGSLYIYKNKTAVLTSILEQINDRINGKLTVKSIDPTLLKGFPGISVSLKDVILSDSLVAKHKHNLLQAADIDISLNVFSLLVGNTKINRITINNASVYIFTDSNGYSNTSIFRSKKKNQTEKQSKSKLLEIEKIDFNDVSLIVDNQKRHKLFNFDITEIKGRVNYANSGWVGNMKLKTLVKSFAFNTNKGSFLKNKPLEGTLSFHYNKDNQQITIDPNKLDIDGYPFIIGSKINIAENASAFAISIKVDNILYKDISLMLAPNISSKLLKFGIEKPININGTIVDDGTGKYADPLINVAMIVRDNIVSLPAGQKLTACSFDGSFTNKDTIGGIIGDENSLIKFKKLNAKYYNISIKVDSFLVNNLAQPIATGLVTSQFPLSDLNDSFGSENFDFKSGNASLSLYCKADIDNFKFTKPVISGQINVQNANIKYLPRNLNIENSALDLNFDQNNLTIKNGHFQLGKSILNLNCKIDNFLNLYYSAPEKILVNLQMHSPQLYLNEFLPLLGPRNTKIKQKTSSKSTVDRLSKVLELSKMKINLRVDKAIYKKFIAKNLDADISLINEVIYFNKIKVYNSGGTLSLSGNINPEDNYNKYSLNATISKVNVKEFFYSFDNFGQKTITNKNLQGYLSALVNINGRISSSGSILPKSIFGKVIFNLNNAALLNFEPITNVGKFAFPNRNVSDIRINNLDGTLNIKGDKVIIDPVMKVSSSVLNFNVKGVYGLTSGTDIAVDIPLRNPKKDEDLNKNEKKETRMRGIVLHLKAIDDEKGGVKIKWNKDHD